MSEKVDNPRAGMMLQLLIVALVAAAGIGIFAMLGVFRPTQPGYRMVTYRIEGTASTGVVTYTQPDGSTTELIEISIPWSKTVKMPKGTVIVLTGSNPTQTGDMTCKLILDGKDWKMQSAKAPKDKVSCAGIVP